MLAPAPNPTEAEKAEGRRLLAELLPLARDMAEQVQLRAVPTPGVAEQTAAYARIDNVDFVHVYEVEGHGWLADAYFKEAPEGGSNVIGTPVHQPCPSREEALRFAVVMLSMLVSAEKAPMAPAAAPFNLCGATFFLPGELVQRLEPMVKMDPRSRDEVLERLGELVEEIFPGGVTPEAIRALPPEAMMILVTNCTIALARGITSYGTDAPPRGAPVH